jgi:hypothetical protein
MQAQLLLLYIVLITAYVAGSVQRQPTITPDFVFAPYAAGDFMFSMSQNTALVRYLPTDARSFLVCIAYSYLHDTGKATTTFELTHQSVPSVAPGTTRI